MTVGHLLRVAQVKNPVNHSQLGCDHATDWWFDQHHDVMPAASLDGDWRMVARTCIECLWRRLGGLRVAIQPGVMAVRLLAGATVRLRIACVARRVW